MCTAGPISSTSLLEKIQQIFEYILDARLEVFATPTEFTDCKDLHCRSETHLEAIDWHAAEVLEAVQATLETALPYPKAEGQTMGKKSTPGFNTEVRHIKDTALFWSAIWKSAGRPLNTKLHTSMKRSRNCYHFKFKKCKKAELKIKKSKLLEACLNGNGNRFKEIKAMRRTKPK